MAPRTDPIEQLRVELAAHRLLMRALTTYIVCNASRAADETLCEISSMLVGTGPYGVPVTDMDDALYARAQALARQRIGDLVAGLSRHALAPGPSRAGMARDMPKASSR